MRKYIKRHIYIIGMIVLATLAMTACTDEPEPVKPDDSSLYKEGYISIDVIAAKAPTRGVNDEPGVDDLNENKINSAVLCLWPQTGDRPETEPPVCFKQFGNLNATGNVTLRVPLTENLRSLLFENEGDGTKCLAYVAVNVDPAKAKTVDELRNLVVSSSFASSQRQPYFTMDGDGIVMLSPDRKAATGTIGAHRSACKITLEVDCDDELTETGDDGNPIVWKSNLSAMTVGLSNGLKTSTLTPRPYENVSADNYFNTDPRLNYKFVNSTTADKDKYPLIQEYPFYTYPTGWTLSPDEENRTTLTLSVPWSSDGGKSYRTCYYHIPVVPVTSTCLVRNTSYHIRIHVGMLGSFTPDIPIEVPDLSYTAADWGEENINVAIDDYRFLVVEQNNYTVNNEDIIQIPFYTSHKTEVISAKLTFYRFNYSEEGSKFPVTIDWASDANNGVFNAHFYNNDHQTIKGSFLQVWHPLKMYQPLNSSGNDIPLTNDDKKTQTLSEIQEALSKTASYRRLSDDEFSRVDIEVTVQHSDMKGQALWKETIYISQFPSIYIDARSNFYTTSDGNISGTGAQGSCYINGNCNNLNWAEGNVYGWTTSIGLSSVDKMNWNPNLYVITVSKLPVDSEYQIGDPRTIGYNNYLTNATMNDADSYKDYKNTPDYTLLNRGGSYYDVKFTTAEDMTGVKRTLRWYYPTQEGNATKNMLSPKFRICSSYAGTSNILMRTTARVRAAAFQEMNYPAGRWRLPTFGEVKFIMDLSAQKKIPRLFGATSYDWYYWCAQGAVFVAKKADAATKPPYVNSNIGNGSFERARFVYDEWYWNNDTISPQKTGNSPYPFRWGDAERIRPNTN